MTIERRKEHGIVPRVAKDSPLRYPIFVTPLRNYLTLFLRNRDDATGPVRASMECRHDPGVVPRAAKDAFLRYPNFLNFGPPLYNLLSLF